MTCAFADKDCFGRIQRHHVIRRNRLKQEFSRGAYRWKGDAQWSPIPREGVVNDGRVVEVCGVGRLLDDPRNLLDICTFHHAQLEAHRIYLAEIPESVHDFARDYGLEGWLERYTKVEATRLVGLENARRRVCPSEYGNG